jgi:hypothetical protein
MLSAPQTSLSAVARCPVEMVVGVDSAQHELPFWKKALDIGLLFRTKG